MDLTHLCREFIPFKKGENFLVNDHITIPLNYPVHYHPEYEIALVINAGGAKQSINVHNHFITDNEFTLIGPYLSHGWATATASDKKSRLITIRFSKKAIKKLKFNDAGPVEEMLSRSANGLLFSSDFSFRVKEKLLEMKLLSDKKYLAALGTLLEEMANTSYQIALPAGNGSQHDEMIDVMIKYLLKNFTNKISLDEIAGYMGISHSSFNRFVKKNTGRTFVSFLNHFRISFAARMLIESDLPVAGIAKQSGFSNLAHFNRIFRNEKNLTPLQFREKFYGSHRFL